MTDLFEFIVCILIIPFVFYKVYRLIFGYTWYSCPNDHDTMARCGNTKCEKCNSEL